ncbi:MAG: hypothetical protein NUV50_11130 [Rhodospirillales bacterium]|nr:hypothetical protein [Rhodospirillales bacterium]
MKIAFGYKMEDGPYGGGNSVIRSMSGLLADAGHTIVWSLVDDDIDIIVLVDPRLRSPNIPFSAGASVLYQAFRNPKAIVIQQIHDCDERKHTRTMNLRQRIANYAADHTVCVGSWMLDLNVIRPEHKDHFTAILNGGETSIFNRKGHKPWDAKGPLKLITHHWGGNWMKGFDVYQHMDNLLANPKWQDVFSFTYVGNVPQGFSFKNATHLPPRSGDALADVLRSHDAYITASINEPAGLHHIEGALCGLPIIFRNSGALPEYCAGYGLSFEGVDDIEQTIKTMRKEYNQWYKSLDSYHFTERKMVDEYQKLFDDLDKKRPQIVSQRRIWRNPLLFALNQIPF